jgi:hypothetical protein
MAPTGDSQTDSGHNHDGSALSQLIERTALTTNAALTLFTFSCVAMGGFMFFHSLSIDDEISLFNSDNVAIAHQGRFLIAAYNSIAQGVIPFFPYVLLATSYLASYTLILFCHGLKHNWRTHLAFLAFILFPVNWLNQEFSGLAGSLAIGQLATCVAAYLSIGKSQKNVHAPIWRDLSPLAITCLVVAISTYQSLVTLYLVICFGQLIFYRRLNGNTDNHSARGENHKTSRPLLCFFLTATIAALLQSLLLKAFLAISRTEVRHINIYFANPYFMLRTQPLQYIRGNLEQLAKTYFTPGVFYGHYLFGFTLVLVGAVFTYAIIFRHRERQLILSRYALLQGWGALGLLLLLLATPLSLNIISKPYRLPMRSFLALPYIAWLGLIIMLELSPYARVAFRRLMPIMLGSILIIQSLVAISHYYAARAFNFRADQLVVASIVSSMVESKQTPSKQIRWLASKGHLERTIPYQTAWYSSAGASFFGWDQGNTTRMAAWIRAMGIEGIEALSPTKAKTLAPVWETMASWPAPGSILVRDDVVMVKFGQD